MVRILLADSQDRYRRYLRSQLDKRCGIEVIAETSDGQSALALARQLRPDVVIIDVVMPRLSGVEASRQILSALPTVKVIALSSYAEREFERAMREAGVSDYLLKDVAIEELSRAIRRVAEGDISESSGHGPSASE